jgi:diaminopimelate decarboxylase
MKSRLSVEDISGTFQRFLMSEYYDHGKHTALIFYDLSMIESRIRELNRLFPEETIHTVAVKANPLKRIMDYTAGLGAGFEAASLPEVHMAIASGSGTGMVVFDSPAKTLEEIKFSLENGIHINADSVAEIERIGMLLKNREPESSVGVRINPQTGPGRIKSTSVAGNYSKFGIPLHETDLIAGTFSTYPWLSGVHVHTGSQGCSLEQLVNGIRKVLDIVLEINKKNRGQIRLFDIGGGLPVQYREDNPLITLEMYRDELRKKCPELFTGKIRLITEFGRYVHANSGWAVSTIEYVKAYEKRTLISHLGADMFLRESYNPENWYHDLFITDNLGHIKRGMKPEKTHVAGPLCFSGDMIGRNIPLPEAVPGDFLIIRDTGAYTVSMWSRYNSRQMPAVIGYTDQPDFIVLKERESIQKVKEFWI